MYYSNMITIPNGTNDTFFGVIAIITVIVLIYTFAYSEITKRKIKNLVKAKAAAVEGLNLRKHLEEEDEDYDEAK